MTEEKINTLIELKKFDDLYNEFMKRAEYLSTHYKDKDERALIVSDRWAMCARDIWIKKDTFIDDQNLINLKNEQKEQINASVKYISEKSEKLASLFCEYNEITKVSLSFSSNYDFGRFQLNPEYKIDSNSIYIKNLIAKDEWSALFHEMIDGDTDSLFEYFMKSIQKCAYEYVCGNIDWYNEEKYQNLKNIDYNKFSFLHDRSVKMGFYYKYILLLKRLELEIDELKGLKEHLKLLKENREKLKIISISILKNNILDVLKDDDFN